MLTLRIAAVGSMLRPTARRLEPSRTSEKALRGHRPVYYEESKDYLKTPIFERTVLGAGLSLEGPAVIEEMDSTTIIRPGQTAEVDDFGNIVISLR